MNEESHAPTNSDEPVLGGLGAVGATGGGSGSSGCGGQKADLGGNPGQQGRGLQGDTPAGGQGMTRKMRGSMTERIRTFKNVVKCDFWGTIRRKESRNSPQNKSNTNTTNTQQPKMGA